MELNARHLEMGSAGSVGGLRTLKARLSGPTTTVTLKEVVGLAVADADVSVTTPKRCPRMVLAKRESRSLGLFPSRLLPRWDPVFQSPCDKENTDKCHGCFTSTSAILLWSRQALCSIIRLPSGHLFPLSVIRSRLLSFVSLLSIMSSIA